MSLATAYGTWAGERHLRHVQTCIPQGNVGPYPIAMALASRCQLTTSALPLGTINCALPPAKNGARDSHESSTLTIVEKNKTWFLRRSLRSNSAFFAGSAFLS